MNNLYPKWHNDLEIFCNIKTSFILEGNIHDLQPWVNDDSNDVTLKPLQNYIYDYLKQKGYDLVVFYNKVDGFYINQRNSKKELKKFYALSNCANSDDDKAEADSCTVNKLPDTSILQSLETALDNASKSIRNACTNTASPVAVVIDLANTVIGSPDMPSEIETLFLTRLFLGTRRIIQPKSSTTGKCLTNTLFYIVEKANDLPAWFYLNNPNTKTITITKMDKELRYNFVRRKLGNFVDYESLSDEKQEKAANSMADLTEGFSAADLLSFITMCKEKKFSVSDIDKAIKLYKYGFTESQWDKLDAEKIRSTKEILSARVKGQSEAIEQAAKIIQRTFAGLSGLQKGSSGCPKGILFLAGPTGTGKTELAKAIAEMVFGDESFITRFDMSEYQQPQSDQKLLGAPPGYVGYGAGGQLTNAVKEKPFNILLFDEIDKAHPSILDKFLQILDDGRMTDSFGETVYFSESLIIFTSNIGMTVRDADRNVKVNVDMSMSYPEIKERITTAIKSFFNDIGRPEILNRMGSNIIVFDFIKEEITGEIVRLRLKKIKKSMLKDKHIALEFSKKYVNELIEKANENLINGGRGIGNKVEEYLINLLPEILLYNDIPENATLRITGITDNNHLSFEIINPDSQKGN